MVQAFKVQYQSTMITFKGREETFRVVGATDPKAIEDIVRKAY